jgi:hypothetical protein
MLNLALAPFIALGTFAAVILAIHCVEPGAPHRSGYVGNGGPAGDRRIVGAGSEIRFL